MKRNNHSREAATVCSLAPQAQELMAQITESPSGATEARQFGMALQDSAGKKSMSSLRDCEDDRGTCSWGSRPRLHAVVPPGLKRTAHSLIEMLVVLIIVGVLLAITIPAVQRSREAARMAQCISHQAQLTQAVHMYVTAERFGRFPGFRYQATDGGSPEIGWAAQLFGYLGRNDLDPTQATFIETLACPSDQGPRDQPRMNYVANGGQAGTDSPADGIFFDHAKPTAERVYISKDDFVDGLTNTILLAENLDATEWDVTDEENQCILWPLTAGNEVNQGAGSRPSSHHPGGFVAAFADGSVKFMAESEINDDSNIGTADSYYVSLLTPGGNDANVLDGGETPTAALGTGRYVRLRRSQTSPQPWMILIEVEVFDPSGTNIALGQPVKVHSVDWNMPGAELVDGLAAGYQNVNANYNGSHTNDPYHGFTELDYPWVVIDLGSQQAIDRIKVWNRCCDGYAWENMPGTVIEIYENDPSPCADLGACPSNGAVAADPPIWSAQTGDPGVPVEDGAVWDLPYNP